MHGSNINQNESELCKLLPASTPIEIGGVRSACRKEHTEATTKTLMARFDAPHRYAIGGGKEGKKRLDLLARVMLPTTMELLDRVGLIRGMKCLDVGCGSGHVAISMARATGPEGRVIGTDTDAEILALAREDAEAAKATNVEFQQQDACACAWREEFDVVYARFLLSHLNEAENCLAAMVQACAPEGTVVIEDTDFAGSFCYPTCTTSEVQGALSRACTAGGWRSKYRTKAASHVASSRYPRGRG